MTHLLTDKYAFEWPICWHTTRLCFQMTHLLTDKYAFEWPICWQTTWLCFDICWQTSMLSNGLSVDIWLDWASNPSAVCLVTGQPTQWQNMTLAGSEGVAQGRVNQNSVSVLVDHFWTKQMSPATQIWDYEWLCRQFHAQMASMCAPCSVTQTPGGSLRQEDISSRKDPAKQHRGGFFHGFYGAWEHFQFKAWCMWCQILTKLSLGCV